MKCDNSVGFPKSGHKLLIYSEFPMESNQNTICHIAQIVEGENFDEWSTHKALMSKILMVNRKNFDKS